MNFVKQTAKLVRRLKAATIGSYLGPRNDGDLERPSLHVPWTQKCDLAICAIFREEAKYLQEWIEFHQLVGVKNFILFDNRSTDNYLEVLKPFISEGVVYLHRWFQHPGQIAAYNFALQQYREKASCIAFIDVDEFLFNINEEETLLSVLEEFSSYGAVAVQWKMFGSNGHIVEPKGLVIDNYTKAAERTNRHYKSIVRPDRTRCFNNPHSADFVDGHNCVDENRRPITLDHNKHRTVKRLRINHYLTKSAENFFNKKSVLPRADTGKYRDAEFFYDSELKNNIVEDRLVLRYSARLNEIMKSAEP